jgi:alkylation response protein AidB-like acyl-CoA dehydrogenase
MDLTFTPEEEAFRAEARAWLERHVPETPLPSMDTPDGFAQHREWERVLHDGGWSVVSWPVDYGGRGASLVEWLIFEEEYYRVGAPPRLNQNGLFLLGPTLMEYGTQAQRARFLPPMAAGDEIWSQGWSEPDAGSDLAAISCRADRREGTYVINGQKTWCSRGAYADWLFGLFRTGSREDRHRGLTFLLVPLDADGVNVRPIAQLDGRPGFAEIFFDDVVVPRDHVVGPEDDGWSVAMATVGFERGVSLRSPGRFVATARRLIELHHRVGDRGDPLERDSIVRAWMNAEAYRLYTYRTVARLLDGETIGPEASLNKLFWSEMDLDMHETALALLGQRAELTGGAPDAVDDGHWLEGYLFALSGPIYAGTNQIQRNIVAERVLGLPRG